MVSTRATPGPSSHNEPVNDPIHEHDGMPAFFEDTDSPSQWRMYGDQMQRYITHKGVEHNLEIAQLRAQRNQASNQLEQATQTAAEKAAEAAVAAANTTRMAMEREPAK
ncbi:hypothetical protein MMC22_009369 [Lobaria immixta]|nr:hypothetical protein [Lobaria immixta]